MEGKKEKGKKRKREEERKGTFYLKLKDAFDFLWFQVRAATPDLALL